MVKAGGGRGAMWSHSVGGPSPSVPTVSPWAQQVVVLNILEGHMLQRGAR